MSRKEDERTVTKQGNSLGLTLPPEFIKSHKIQQKTKLKVLFDGLLIVFPNEQAYEEFKQKSNQQAVDLIDKISKKEGK